MENGKFTKRADREGVNMYIARFHIRQPKDTIKLSIKCCDGDDEDDDFDSKLQNSFIDDNVKRNDTHFMKTYEIRCIWCRIRNSSQ